MARKLTKEELERYKADFDPPAWATKTEPPAQDENEKPKRRGNPKGRPPSEKPRLKNLHIRLSEEDAEMIDEAARLTGQKKTAVIVEGVKRVYEEAAAKAWTKARADFKEHGRPTA